MNCLSSHGSIEKSSATGACWHVNTDISDSLWAKMWWLSLFMSSLYIHRVLNTDNMSIIGVTMDYGPYGFIDQYEPGFVCNSSGVYLCTRTVCAHFTFIITCTFHTSCQTQKCSLYEGHSSSSLQDILEYMSDNNKSNILRVPFIFQCSHHHGWDICHNAGLGF